MLETVVMMVLTWMYNDLGGADEHFQVRNFINALGFMCYSSGSTVVAAGYGEYILNDRAYSWLAIVGTVVFSTLSMQDMADIPGDSARGRRTLPLVYGERFARWAIAIPVIFWSILCPLFWGLGVRGYVAPVAVGSMLAFRVLFYRSITADKISWKLWCFWTIVLYLLPLVKNPDALFRW